MGETTELNVATQACGCCDCADCCTDTTSCC